MKKKGTYISVKRGWRSKKPSERGVDGGREGERAFSLAKAVEHVAVA